MNAGTRRAASAVEAVMVSAILGATAAADVRLPAVFSDHMVVQSGVQAPVWGWADAGEKVQVSLAGQKAEATADEQGRWIVRFKRMKAGGPHEMTVTGKNSLTVKDVLVGEVWLCSGQSNMAMPVSGVTKRPVPGQDGERDIATADYPGIRMFAVERKTASEPQHDCMGAWVVCSTGTVGAFSATAYFFGRQLHQDLKAPVGLINSSWGGTPAEAWTARKSLEADPELAPIVQKSDGYPGRYPQLAADYEKLLQAKQETNKVLKAQGKPELPLPRKPAEPDKNPHLASTLYNGMIAPLVPYGIRGAIWYQGESNAGRAYQYRRLLPAMIRNWRECWKQEFPFGVVQLPNFMKPQTEPSEDTSHWPELREAQLMTCKSVPKAGIAVTIDVGEENDIHPLNKQDVGKRLALWALNRVYEKDVACSGPIYRAMKKEGNSIRVSFDHADGLAYSGGDKNIRALAVAGADKVFHWAKARIERRALVVFSEEVPDPVAVRYGWANNPSCNLCNSAGLPASPFRTDDWPGATIGKNEP